MQQQLQDKGDIKFGKSLTICHCVGVSLPAGYVKKWNVRLWRSRTRVRLHQEKRSNSLALWDCRASPSKDAARTIAMT
ncbi:hypothetical protein [Nostoc sp. ChiQUE01b]|uniref:hypothetical protein n=1 Tax=Nostoc sp. ChiQUE01b TaxID=3075376 RepID=UPI002AD40447|nr:hypothetical protein [Nostoc sp. ChiQUE01b]